ncbi:MAG: hypothetical protein ACKVHF_05025 [Candidatus Poseidoniales archaeon]|jgi:hypothetical protein|tara:strand:+ start:4599 stop:5282 length:684 start_codon:yes stop_codon:yes gene_type:complete
MIDTKYDILPLGEYETIPVTSLIPPYPEYFNEVVRLGVKTDVNQLQKDLIEFDLSKQENYVVSRARYFKQDIRETLEMFESLNFGLGENYAGYPVRKKGTNEIQEHLGEYTKTLLETIGVPLFRQQYVAAGEMWNTKLHADHPDFSVHGFRIFIPIDVAYIGFEDNIYLLEPGDCYFVNIAKLHRGISEHHRVVLMAQMASDKLIRTGYQLAPMDKTLLPEYLRDEP